MQNVAQGWLVLRMTDSALLLGIVAASASLPVLLLSVPAGALADQIPRRTVLLAAHASGIVLALLLAGLTFTNTVEVWHIIVLAALSGATRAIEAPARQAFTIEMVGKEDLLNAIALNSTMFNTARTLGPAAAGLLVAAAGEGPAFLLNGLSYLAVIVALLMMRLPPFTAPALSRRRDQLREGLQYVWHEPTVRTLLLMAGGLCLFGYLYIPLLPVFARNVFHTDAEGLGWLAAANGGGALLAALFLAQFS
ncbi:MAG: MFS transporter, partial [Chloroflexaceae bacterium]|nr:MFS transporter [Chloroflexaceae bacterium]